MGPEEMEVIAGALARALESGEDAQVAGEIRRTVSDLCAAFPLV
jgi:glycine/serine hydroxymethyltransferase